MYPIVIKFIQRIKIAVLFELICNKSGTVLITSIQFNVKYLPFGFIVILNIQSKVVKIIQIYFISLNNTYMLSSGQYEAAHANA